MIDDRRTASLAVVLTHGVADNATTAFATLTAGNFRLEANPIYRQLYAEINSLLILEGGMTGPSVLLLGSLLTAIVGTLVASVAAGLLYSGWHFLESVPGFQYWLAAVLVVGTIVPVTNLVILGLELGWSP